MNQATWGLWYWRGKKPSGILEFVQSGMASADERGRDPSDTAVSGMCLSVLETSLTGR